MHSPQGAHVQGLQLAMKDPHDKGQLLWSGSQLLRVTAAAAAGRQSTLDQVVCYPLATLPAASWCRSNSAGIQQSLSAPLPIPAIICAPTACLAQKPKNR